MSLSILLSPARSATYTCWICRAEAAFVAKGEESAAGYTLIVEPAGIAVGIVFADLHEDAFDAAGSAGRCEFWGRILLL
jgi:hypothetical protein